MQVCVCAHSSPLIKAVAFYETHTKRNRCCSYEGLRCIAFFSEAGYPPLCKYAQCGPSLSSVITIYPGLRLTPLHFSAREWYQAKFTLELFRPGVVLVLRRLEHPRGEVKERERITIRAAKHMLFGIPLWKNHL